MNPRQRERAPDPHAALKVFAFVFFVFALSSHPSLCSEVVGTRTNGRSCFSSSKNKWNVSCISSVSQLDAWRSHVATKWAAFQRENKLEIDPVRVYVSHVRWMSRTSAPSALQPDGSRLIQDCDVPCSVDFQHDDEGRRASGAQTVNMRETIVDDSYWTRWATKDSRVRSADVVMQVDRPWDARQLERLRALYPHKRAVFASWEPLGTAYRTDSFLRERNYDWLASFTFGGPGAADVPSTYEGLDHSDAFVAEFWRKREETWKSSSVSSRSLGRRRHFSKRSGDADAADDSSDGDGGRGRRNVPIDKASSSNCRGTKSPVFMAVSNCDSNAGERKRLLSAFMEVLPVDSYGSCLRNSQLSADSLPGCAALPVYDWRARKECMMSCYPFVLSLESTHTEVDYATEKLFDPLVHDTVVPIYLGPPNERDFLPPGAASRGVIFVRDFVPTRKGSTVDAETMRRVARHVASLARNATAMRELLDWKNQLSEQVGDAVAGESGNGDTKERRRANDDDFPFRLRSWFSHRRFFCNLCTRYAAERVGIAGYDF